MSEKINLSDPAFEPSGEQLQALASRAFAGVRVAREQSQERLRAEIARRRKLVLEALTSTETATPEPGT
jgi:hypothetical protein